MAGQSKIRRKNLVRRLALPLVLVSTGFLLLFGCIPIPATRQLQPDFRARPERAVGSGANSPVQIGKTTIEDAFIELSKRVRTSSHVDNEWAPYSSSTSQMEPRYSMYNWRVSPDGKTFALTYQIRVATLVAPLCFQAAPQTAARWLVLDVNSSGIVERATTVAEPPMTTDRLEIYRLFEIFNAAQRKKLYDAGVLPSDEMIEQAMFLYKQAVRNARAFRSPATTQSVN